MLGYKIAVGFDNNGPFPVLITLEIPEEAKVIDPVDKLEIPVLEEGKTKILKISKLRTHMANVVKIEPLELIEKPSWNGKAFSLYTLSTLALSSENTLLMGCWQFIYETNKKVFADIFDAHPEHSCTKGIHFFKTKYEAGLFYYHDTNNWAMRVVNRVQYYWTKSNDVFKSWLNEKEI